MTPDVAATGVVIRVDVQDPLGAQSSDTRIVSLTRQSSLALIIAVLIAVVLGIFLLFGFLRARRNATQPVGPPPLTPLPPAILAPVGAAACTSALAPGKKVCPRCQTHVSVVDVTALSSG